MVICSTIPMQPLYISFDQCYLCHSKLSIAIRVMLQLIEFLTNINSLDFPNITNHIACHWFVYVILTSFLWNSHVCTNSPLTGRPYYVYNYALTAMLFGQEIKPWFWLTSTIVLIEVNCWSFILWTWPTIIIQYTHVCLFQNGILL